MIDELFRLNSVGLIYDGVGVVILGFAFFTKSVKAMTVESGTYYGGNDALLKSLIQSRTDGMVGTLVLFLGFLFQFLGAVGVECVTVAKGFMVGLLVMLIGYVFFIRKRFVDSQFSSGKKLMQE
jgi:hypothetical protein